MNLNDIAESDLSFTLEDTEAGFGVDLVFLDSESEEVTIPCKTTDISYFVDPETGQGVETRTIEITGRITTFASNDVSPAKGAIVKYYDTNKILYKTCIKQIMPDKKMGILKIILEARA